MDSNVVQCFAFNYKDIIIDEIALQGLEGIGLDYLWKRVERRISTHVTIKMKFKFWNLILNSKCISFYELPVPVPAIDMVDRFMLVEDEMGHLKDPDDYLDGPYEYCPIENEYGSCKYFHTRIPMPTSMFNKISYDKIECEYGERMVMVASIKERWHALSSHMPLQFLSQLTQIHYCILELVGRSRENGQTTTGNTNLLKIIKEPKILYYNRKALQILNLIKVQYVSQVVGGRGVKSLLLRIKKFHQPSILTLPKVGTLHRLVQYLCNQPGLSETTDTLVKKGIVTIQQCKRLNKTVNVFRFYENTTSPESENQKSKKVRSLKRRYLTLTPISDESSQSEDETQAPTKCQYKVGVNIMLQAYERLLDAGLSGLTQLELTEMLGVEFYTGRTICRLLKASKVVREFLEDKGKQRMAKFVAIASKDAKYAEEKKKFMKYINDNIPDTEVPSTSAEAENEPVAQITEIAPETTENLPLVQTETLSTSDNDFEIDVTPDTIKEAVSEVKVLDGCERLFNKSLMNSGKALTLRQLKFANGLLKVINDNLLIPGFQTLSNLVANEINEPPLDAKALKSFLQRLMTDKQLKIIKMKWPGSKPRFTAFTCAYHIQLTDPIIMAKYKEITLKAISTQKKHEKKEYPKCTSTSTSNPFNHVTYPRYMKLRKLHEFVINFAYFEENQDAKESRQGIVSMVDVLPELTVEFALGNISSCSLDININKLTKEMLTYKIRNAPPDIRRSLLQTPSFHYNIKFNLRILGVLGLIQLIQNPTQTGTYHNNSLSNFVFYVNRNAKIVDTTGRWPRPNADLKSLETSFYFKTPDDVQDYWNTVYAVSTSTSIELENRDCKKLQPPIRNEAEVALYDNGERYGDGDGPCGFDACLFMELPRLWYSFYLRAQKAKMMKKIQMKITKPEKVKKARKKKVEIKQVKRVGPRMRMPRMANKTDTSVTWTEQEDNVIVMCKAAITIMSPSSQMGCLRVRNLVAKDILNLHDPKKVPTLCHKRAITLEATTKAMYQKDRILNEMRRRPHLIQKYEGLLKKLRIKNATYLNKFINEARVCLLELIWVINLVVRSKTYRERVPCVAVDYEHFHQNFTILSSTTNKAFNSYRTDDYPALKEAIVMSIMQAQNGKLKPDISKKVYAAFKGYRENTLRIVIEQLRKCGSISAQEKLLYNRVNRLNLEDLSQTSYKMSMTYKRKWICRLNGDFVDDLSDNLNSEMPQNGIMGAPEINCMFWELQADGAIELVSSAIPVITNNSGSLVYDEQLNVLDIESKYKLKSGSLGWRSKNDAKITIFADALKDQHLDRCMQTVKKTCAIATNTERNTSEDTEDKIIAYLKVNQKGATFQELQEISGYDVNTLRKKIAELESRNIAHRAGFHENIIVLTEHIKDWSIKLGEKTVIPAPWLTIDAEIKYDILLKWAGALMNKIFESPGCSIRYLSESCEFLTCRGVQDLCMFLQNGGCVKLQTVRTSEVDLFSDEDAIPQVSEFNPYESVHNIFVFPFHNSFTMYAHLRKTILDKFGQYGVI